MGNLSRRTFLAGVGLFGAGAVASTSLIACSPSNNDESNNQNSVGMDKTNTATDALLVPGAFTSNKTAGIGFIRDIKRVMVIQSQADVDLITATNGVCGYNGCGGSQGPQDLYAGLLAEEIERGNDRIYKANTIAELAVAAGLDPDALQETVNRYNAILAAGVDEDFRKDPMFLEALSPLEEGPFYCFECNDGFFTTIGGVRINEEIQAVDDDGNVIEGLYVAGCDTGALCGDIYDFTSAPGEQSSWALSAGRMVAKHVAATL